MRFLVRHHLTLRQCQLQLRVFSPHGLDGMDVGP